MHFNALVAATALAGLIPSTLAKGSATVKNQCDTSVNIWTIADSAHEEMSTIKSGDSYSEEFQENDNGGGISIKVALDDDHDEVSQFEYTLAPESSKVFYDLSNIDGYPFQKGGASITASDDSCPSVSCPAGVKECKDAYNQPFDDHATSGCSDETDLTLTLCSDSQGDKKRNIRHPHWYTA